jgi:2-C-methyl-D-erythritol 4-phosphate cytidylyltransferase
VVLVAAGKGERLGAPMPKQFLPLEGHPVFSYSLRLFDSLAFVTQIAIVLPPAGIPANQRHELEHLAHPRVCVPGGLRRQDSVASGLAALTEPYDVALVHDAARPFPDPADIAKLITITVRTGGGLLAMRSPDTVKRAAPDETVAETLDRAAIWLAQTPQAIRADLVPRAIESFRRADLDVTDEAGLLEQWGIPVALVESSMRNFKITRPADLAWARAILAWDKIKNQGEEDLPD